MPGLVRSIHVFLPSRVGEDGDGRDKPGHGDVRVGGKSLAPLVYSGVNQASVSVHFPKQAYTQGEQFHREKTALFPREWLLFAAAAQLAAPGRYLSQTIGGWPVLAVAGDDGRVRVFRNVCRHQQMPVVDQAAGACAQLRCRYHGWTYDLAGRFLAAPPLVAPADPAPERNSLDPLGLHEAEGLLFIQLEPDAAAPGPSIPLDGRRFVEAVTSEVSANWKAAAEALLDAPGWRLEWPLGFVRDEGGARIVRRVIPRSFTRTRFIDLVFTSGEPAPEAIGAAALADKEAAEAHQARLGEGTAPPPSAAIIAFRERVAAVAPPG
jgi:nitrite reductase/ring-hydroxylating ferredoxin subunit